MEVLRKSCKVVRDKNDQIQLEIDEPMLDQCRDVCERLADAWCRRLRDRNEDTVARWVEQVKLEGRFWELQVSNDMDNNNNNNDDDDDGKRKEPTEPEALSVNDSVAMNDDDVVGDDNNNNNKENPIESAGTNDEQQEGTDQQDLDDDMPFSECFLPHAKLRRIGDLESIVTTSYEWVLE